MSSDFYDEKDRQLIEQLENERHQKAEQFKLNIDEDVFDESASAKYFDEPDELTSYSGEDVREQMARDSKHALKQKKKEEKKLAKKKNKRNRRTFRLFWVISVIIVGAMAGMFLVAGINDMLAINRPDQSTVIIEIPANPDVDTVAEVLKENGVIDEESYFKMFANLTKSDDEFSQGTYEIRKNMDYEAIINYLLNNANRTDSLMVTITEGESVLEIADTLFEAGALSDKDKFLELCNSDTFDEDYDFLQNIDNSDDRYYKLEGYLYPDTYEFYVNEDPENAIYRFLNNYEAKLYEKQEVSGYEKSTSINKMVENSDYSLDEIMTIASIIQAEAADVEDMYYISSVLHNRLEADVDEGVSNLSLDSTKYYPYRSQSALPDDIKDSFVSSYDTYEIEGLPAGPICNPGMNAIVAALNPYDTGYYYFCHDKDGGAYYASTIYEHNLNLEYIE